MAGGGGKEGQKEETPTMEEQATQGSNNRPELVIFWLLMIMAERILNLPVPDSALELRAVLQTREEIEL